MKSASSTWLKIKQNFYIMQTKFSNILTLTPGMLGPRRTSCMRGCGVCSVTGPTELGISSSQFCGAGTSRSVVWLTLVRPGRGSNAGIRAENWRFSTNSSSQERRLPLPPVVLSPPVLTLLPGLRPASYPSSSCTHNHSSS